MFFGHLCVVFVFLHLNNRKYITFTFTFFLGILTKRSCVVVPEAVRPGHCRLRGGFATWAGQPTSANLSAFFAGSSNFLYEFILRISMINTVARFWYSWRTPLRNVEQLPRVPVSLLSFLWPIGYSQTRSPWISFAILFTFNNDNK